MNSLRQNLVLTFLTLLLFGGAYPLFIWGVGQIFPNAAEGLPIYQNRKLIGYENIGQSFDTEKYFNSRPSAVGYNAAATGGSNQGPTNPAHIEAVKSRRDTLLKYNIGLRAEQIPCEMVTASGGGLDPHISPESAKFQIARIAKIRNLSKEKLTQLIEKHTQKPALGFLGTERVNVLKLNIALDQLK